MPTITTTHLLASSPFRGTDSAVPETRLQEVPESHVVTVPEQLLEFRVYLLYRTTPVSFEGWPGIRHLRSLPRLENQHGFHLTFSVRGKFQPEHG